METKKYPEFESAGRPDFKEVWGKYIIHFKDRELSNSQGGKYLITDVNGSEITRFATSNKRSRAIPFQKCQEAYNALLNRGGYISRDDILAIVGLWCSSFIVSLFAELPFIEETSNPRGLQLI